MYEYLNRINSPDDLKKLKINELEILAEEIREGLFNRLSKIGGHFGPNFGFVEPTIALHYVFNSPKDKIVYDVSHQSYTHKMLTGRKNGYIIDECFSEDSGYTNPEESEHDLFNIGHTSTSISLATGLAKGRDLLGGKENVIAVIGDGSLSGGEALEGLNVSGSELGTNLIIIINDNQQSISETHGGIYKNLKELRETKGKAENNMFTAIGLDYIYEENGNDIESLINVFKKVKDIDHPIVVHLNTKKGKGYKLAEIDKESWHWTMPFNRETGERITFSDESYTSIAKEFVMNQAKNDKRVVVITANVPGVLELGKKERDELGEQFVDVGIAEEQAVAMASGVAKIGCKPIVVTNMSFMQRTYDQVSQDVCLNKTPVTFLIGGSSFESMRDATHIGIFGLPIFANIPNLVLICPNGREELIEAINYSLNQTENPVMILIPNGKVYSKEIKTPISFINKYEVLSEGDTVAIISLGDFYQRGLDLSNKIKTEFGISPTFINPRFAELDKECLDKLTNHQIIITLEDGVKDGGFGQKISSYLGNKDIKVLNYGLGKKFYDRYNPSELAKEVGFDTDSIIKDLKSILGR